MITTFRKNKYYKIILWICTLTILSFTLFQFKSYIEKYGVRKDDDFVEYWSAGKLNRSGRNPYDPEFIYKTELSVGYQNIEPLLMWNPPWMLSFAMPLSFFNYPLIRSSWVLITLAVVLLCSGILWDIYGGDKKYRYISWLISITFMPVLNQLYLGQSGFLLLAGVVGFLYFIRREKDLLAGMCLSFLAIKPHVGYLFLVVVFLWSIARNRWLLLAVPIVVVLITTMIACIANPNVINQFIYAFNNYPPVKWIPSTLGSYLREAFGHQYFGILFLPSVLGLIWVIYLWFRKKSGWDWLTYTPLIILVSVVTTPYGWYADQILSLIAMIQLGVMTFSIRKKTLPFYSIIAVYVLLDLSLFYTNLVYHWFATALLLFYLGAMNYIQLLRKNITEASNNLIITT